MTELEPVSPWVDTAPRPRPRARPRRRFRDAPHWILVGYALAQAVVSTLLVFEVITTTTIASAVTAVALIGYVAASELTVGRWRRLDPDEP